MTVERRFLTVEMMIARAMMSNTPTSTPTTMPTFREIPDVEGSGVLSVSREEGEG